VVRGRDAAEDRGRKHWLWRAVDQDGAAQLRRDCRRLAVHAGSRLGAAAVVLSLLGLPWSLAADLLLVRPIPLDLGPVVV
jgi:hypothetical protein